MSKPAGKKTGKRSTPLAFQIDPQLALQGLSGKTTREEISDDLKEAAVVSGKMSKKVLKAVKDQRLEMEHNKNSDETQENMEAAEATRKKLSEITSKALLTGNYDDDYDDESNGGKSSNFDVDAFDEEVDDQDDSDNENFSNDENLLDLGAEDRALLEAFLPKNAQNKKNLTENILSGVDQRQTTLALGIKQAKKETDVELKSTVPKQVIITYQKIGQFLSKYRSGKLPKAFKIIPTLKNWEEIMYYTNPADWTPQATNAATKLFATVLKPKNAQRFYSLVLAPKVSSQLAQEGKLGYHLYDAVKRAIYKPTAFFKGFILPLAAGFPAPPFPGQEQAPLSKEVIVYASILNRLHIPQVHAAVTLLQLSKITPFNPYNVLLMKVLIDKKFSLPVPVLEGLLAYFYETACDDDALIPVINAKTGKTSENLPLLWHKTLLHFVQRYKSAFTNEMIAMTRAILKKRPHHSVSDEIRRELAVAGGVVTTPVQVINTAMFDME